MADEKQVTRVGEQDDKLLSILMNPFPGLRPFTVEESHLFFGREGQSDEVLTKLSENHFAAILGTSGSGKSSLMYCGLIPILHGGWMTHAGSDWRVIVSRPGINPIDNLADGFMMKDPDFAGMEEEDKLLKKTVTATVLRSSSLGLIEAVKQYRKSPTENFLILIDQFEELFRYNRIESRESEDNESLTFVNLMLEAINQREEPIYVAITMRSDFIGECAQFPEFTQKINDSHYLIPQMTREQKKTALDGPVAVGGGEIAPRLVQQILNDVGDNPDQLPIMQHALMRTWSYWTDYKREGEVMDLKHYNAVGRLTEALSQHANEAYDELSKREKRVCEIMFKALTESGLETVGIRRPTKLGVIAKIAGVNEEEVGRVVDKFREPGRTLLMPPYGIKLDSETVIDISHESLMRNWTRLKAWVQEEATSSQMYLKLAEASEAYQSGRAGLWRMPDLQLAINWKEEHKPSLVWAQRYHPAFERAIVFLDTSQNAFEAEQANKERIQRRNLRRARTWAIGLGAFGLVAIFLVVFARTAAAEAEKQREAADIARRDSDAQRDAAVVAQQKADSSAVVAQQQEALANEQRDLADLERAAAEVARIQADSARADAEVKRLQAVASQREAERQQKIADEQRIAAEKATEEATRQRLAAERLRYQSVAKQMAIKSLQVEDTSARALIALQGHRFNVEHDGTQYDPDIYSGLFGALKLLKGDSINHLKGHTGAVRSMAYSNSGQYLYTASGAGEMVKWDMEHPGKISASFYNSQRPIRKLLISPDDRWLIGGDQEGDIEIFDLSLAHSGDTLIPRIFAMHHGEILDMVFLPDGSGFISTSTDSTLQFHDLDNHERIVKTPHRVNSLDVSSDGRWLAGGISDGTVSLWDLENDYTEITMDIPQRTSVRAVAFSHQFNLLAVGYRDGVIMIWKMDDNELYAELPGHSAFVSDLEFSRDDKLLASASFDKRSHIYLVEEIFALPIVLVDHDQFLWGVNLSPNGEILITGSDDRIIREWPTNAGVYASEFCAELSRNLSNTEWLQYVGEDIPYTLSCEEKPAGEGATLDSEGE